MEDRDTIPDRARCDQAVDARSHRDAPASCLAVKIDRLIVQVSRHDRFQQPNRAERDPGSVKGRITIEALQHFLDDRQACDDLRRTDRGLKSFAVAAAKDLDPDAGIYEHVNQPAAFREEIAGWPAGIPA